ncbi:hypothetical protein [Leptospira ainazelensis]|uniref:hypothetical protein n=1 Tax=Leptospira ainazelensis TaxID=2810034 RepID=UPI0019623A30|nr:hypothetical protein [Leptospira ainazelensis]
MNSDLQMKPLLNLMQNHNSLDFPEYTESDSTPEIRRSLRKLYRNAMKPIRSIGVLRNLWNRFRELLDENRKLKKEVSDLKATLSDIKSSYKLRVEA